MDGLTCDMCGRSLLVEEDVRYVADITVYAAYDVMEITTEDLARRNIRAEIEAALRQTEGRTAKELEEEVIAKRRLDLCPSCRREFLADPLAKGKRERG